MYFGGVTEAHQEDILNYTGFKKGMLPFKHLEVPLSLKKLTVNQCQPLIDRMMQSIQNLSVKFLSYAGRLQLIQRVLLSIQNFWSQIFLLPKKVLQQVETICKRFLWNGEVQNRGKALLAWEVLCQPKVAGVLNIMDIPPWNKAAVIKHLWSLTHKKDKLWVVWVHTYYIKRQKS